MKKELGRGGIGTVYLAYSSYYKQDFAIKFVKSGDATFRNEVRSMGTLMHPSIVNIYKYSEVEDLSYIVMEYCKGGTLEELIRNKPQISMDERVSIAKKIIKAVAYCHKHGFAHRDIKPSNILLDGNCNPKLADFGLSKVYKTGEMNTRRVGSLPFFAPEMFNEIPLYDPFKADVWALGQTLYYITCGNISFVSKTTNDLIIEITKMPINFWQIEGTPLCSIIKKMLLRDPYTRASLYDIIKHPLFAPALSNENRSKCKVSLSVLNSLTSLGRPVKPSHSNLSMRLKTIF